MRLFLPRLVTATLGFLAMGPTLAQSEFVTIDRFVPHTSTVPANEGSRVGLFVREKMTRATANSAAAPAEVVLFVHGGSVPSVPDYDLPYADYSWMEYLAAAGFDTFAMDQTGYGFSPRPTMDEPCNLSDEDQQVVMPHPLSRPCEQKYTRTLTSLYSDWDEIDTVVDYIRTLRGVDRVHLIGWSRGGRRMAGYAGRHPDKVGRVVLFAPGYDPATPSDPTLAYTDGVPMSLQTRDTLMHDRWEASVACENQVDPGIRDVIWRTIMSFDALGSVWGPAEGVMRARAATGVGWNKALASRISAPTMIIVGEQDASIGPSRALYGDLAGTSSKVLIEMACATHFAVWETTQYKFMHEASREWLTTGEFRGQPQGIFRVGIKGAPR